LVGVVERRLGAAALLTSATGTDYLWTTCEELEEFNAFLQNP